MARKCSGAITIKFGSDRRSQASVADLFAALKGEPPPAKCATCGGVTEPGAACGESGRCGCCAARETEATRA